MSEQMEVATECNHKWKWISDWYGDPSIPNGTVDCSRWQCELCDEQDLTRGPPRRGEED